MLYLTANHSSKLIVYMMCSDGEMWVVLGKKLLAFDIIELQHHSSQYL